MQAGGSRPVQALPFKFGEPVADVPAGPHTAERPMKGR